MGAAIMYVPVITVTSFLLWYRREPRCSLQHFASHAQIVFSTAIYNAYMKEHALFYCTCASHNRQDTHTRADFLLLHRHVLPLRRLPLCLLCVHVRQDYFFILGDIKRHEDGADSLPCNLNRLVGIPSTGSAGLINTIHALTTGSIVTGVFGVIATVGVSSHVPPYLR